MAMNFHHEGFAQNQLRLILRNRVVELIFEPLTVLNLIIVSFFL